MVPKPTAIAGLKKANAHWCPSKQRVTIMLQITVFAVPKQGILSKSFPRCPAYRYYFQKPIAMATWPKLWVITSQRAVDMARLLKRIVVTIPQSWYAAGPPSIITVSHSSAAKAVTWDSNTTLIASTTMPIFNSLRAANKGLQLSNTQTHQPDPPVTHLTRDWILTPHLSVILVFCRLGVQSAINTPVNNTNIPSNNSLIQPAGTQGDQQPPKDYPPSHLIYRPLNPSPLPQDIPPKVVKKY